MSRRVPGLASPNGEIAIRRAERSNMQFQSHKLMFAAYDFRDFGGNGDAERVAVASVHHAIDALGPAAAAELHTGLQCNEDEAMDLGLRLAADAARTATRGWSIWSSKTLDRPGFTLGPR